MWDGTIRLTVAHSVPNTPVYNVTRANYYNTITDTNVRDFFKYVVPSKSPLDGSPTWEWGYTLYQYNGLEANEGIHLAYDIWGLFIAWQHGTAPDILNDSFMQSEFIVSLYKCEFNIGVGLVNTMQNAIWNPKTSE